MSKLYLDAGTTWSKIIQIKNNDKPVFDNNFIVNETENRWYYIVPSKNLNSKNYQWQSVTGHMSVETKQSGAMYTNEVIALAKGAQKLNLPDKDYIILDLGSRDVKWVRFENNKFKDLDWNSSCASSTGATVEMLLKFYDLTVYDLKFNKEKYNITCGIFGLEKIMDDIAKGENTGNAISKFVHGVAFNAWSFANKPQFVYLSGGFCENDCFVKSLSQYAKVEKLGRFVLAEGLI